MVEPLEPRVLFSADVIPLSLSNPGDADDQSTINSATSLQQFNSNFSALTSNTETSAYVSPPVSTQVTTQPIDDVQPPTADSEPGTLPPTELVFVDFRIPDAQLLIDELTANSRDDASFRIVAISDDANGVDVVTDTLKTSQEVSAIHIISHGWDGNLLLGNELLNSEYLAQHSDTISSWQQYLSHDADILIYGCDVAETRHGESFINTLANITGADIAASNDTAGHEALDGNWQFEYVVGSIEAELALSHSVQATYHATLATIVVDTTVDENIPGGGTGVSLREAILEANANATPDTIILGADTYTLTLSGYGDVHINSDIEILGAGTSSTIIDASGLSDRAFQFSSGTSTFSGLTIQGGQTTSGLGGGAIFISGGADLTLDSVVVKNNISSNKGGGIANTGNLTIHNSTIANNTATTNDGGGLRLDGGTVTVTNSTFSGNTARHGGGIHVSNGSTHSFTNVTVSGNEALDGGGIKINGSSATLNHVTVTNNEGTAGVGGILRDSGTLTVGNSIIAGNTGTGNQEISGTISSNGNNIIGDNPNDAAGGNGYPASNDHIDDQSLQLGALADNGGSVQTHELIASNVGIDGAAGSISDDARGFLRTDGNADIGAYEAGLTAQGVNTAPSFDVPAPPEFTESTVDTINGAADVSTADVDGDGDLDLISASFSTDTVAWHENDGNGNFTSHIVTNTADGARSTTSADVDGDGDIDLLSASHTDDTIAWYENDGNQNFTTHTITTAADGAISVTTTDIDGDGDLDVVSASEVDHTIAWYENDGNQNFTTHVLSNIAYNAFSVTTDDIEGDGDIDVVSAARSDGISWYENDGSENFTVRDILDSTVSARAVTTADLDGDSDIDVLSASLLDHKIAWYENSGTATDHTITTNAQGAYDVATADLDGDGDLDVLSASFQDDRIAWYENDGSQNFTEHTITSGADGAYSVIAGDFDGDGDLDVASASTSDGRIAWYENDGGNFITSLDGSPTFVEDGPPVVLDADVQIIDAELAANGNYDGATLYIGRASTANAEDEYSGSGSLGTLIEGDPVILNSTSVGTVNVNSGGELMIEFNAAATQTDVNGVLQAICYSNTSNTPPSTVDLTWTFHDNNDGSQGSGGILFDSGTMIVNITPANDAPVTGGFEEIWLADETPLTQINTTSLTTNSAHQEAQITIDGQKFYHGVGTHPSGTGSVVEYALNGATSFTAIAGLNDTLVSGGQVIFRAYVDGVELFNSGSVTHTTASIPVSVDTTGGNVLRLEIDTVGTGAADHAVWADAMLTGGAVQPTTITLAETATDGTFVGTYQGSDPDTNDTPTYSLPNDTAGPFAIDSNTGVITVSDETQLDFESPINNHAITVRIADGTTFTDHVITIAVTDINEQPTGTDNTIQINEDSSHTFQAGDFGFNDQEGDTLSAVHIASLPIAGTLTLDGTPVNLNSIIPAADLAKLQFTPVPDANGFGYDSFDFTVRDSRQQFASSTNTLTFDVMPVNDAPVTDLDGSATSGLHYATTFNEDSTPIPITGSDANFNDIDGDDYSSLTISLSGFTDGIDEHVIIGNVLFGYANPVGTTTTTVGGTTFSMSFDGTDFTITKAGGGVIPQSDLTLLLQGIRFEHTGNAPTAGDRLLQFVAVDENSASSLTSTSTVTVVSTNDAPVLSTIESAPAVYVEDASPLTITNNLSLGDADNVTIESATITISGNLTPSEDNLIFSIQSGITGSYNATTGIMELTGSATLANYQTALRSVTYENTSGNPSNLTRTVSFEVNDGTDNSNTVTRDIEIRAVNDAPNGSNNTFVSLEDTTHTFAAWHFGFSDWVESHGLQSVFITTLPSNGVLELGGVTVTANQEIAVADIAYLTFQPDSDSNGLASFTFKVRDDGGTDNGGVDTDQTPNTYSISITPVNDAPVLSAIEATPAAFAENGTPVSITNNLQLSDVDDTQIDSATVSISGNFIASQDELLFTDQFGITSTYNTATGVLTLTGSASVADYQAALRTVTYNNTSDNPSDLTRTVSFSINDVDNNSNTVTRSINFVAVNDAPTLSTIEGQPALYIENGSVRVTGNLSLADSDDTHIETATVAIVGNFANGEDVLNFTDQAGITGSYDNSTGELTLTGSATLADYQAAIQSITYHNTSDNPSDLTRTVSFIINDGDDDSNNRTRDINVTAVNDAPVLSTIEGQPAQYSEDAPPIQITGNLSLADIDDTHIESATVAIVGNFANGEDVLNFTDQAGITGSYDNSTGELTLTGSATLADYQTAIQSVTYHNTSDNPSDLTRTVSFIINDGDDDSNDRTRDISFTAVNDAPVLSTIEGQPAQYSEDAPPIQITGNLSLADNDDTHIESATVAVVGNFANGEDVLSFSDQAGITGNYDSTTGELTLTGSATLADYQTAIQSITYHNTSDNPSDLTRTVSFIINDGDDDSNIRNRDIEINSSNDAPVFLDLGSSALYTENDSPQRISDNIQILDPDDTIIETATVSIIENFASSEDILSFTDQSGITGSYDSSSGVLLLTGSAPVSDYQTAIESITYYNNSDNPSDLTRTLSFVIGDGDDSSNIITRDIIFTSVNDAPELLTIEASPIVFTEKTSPISITDTLQVTDVDDSNIDAASISITENFAATEDELIFINQSGISGIYDPASGVLTLSGIATVAEYQNAIRSVTYDNSSDNPSTLPRTVSIEVSDGQIASVTVNRGIEIISINDAPALSAIEIIPATYVENSIPLNLTDSIITSDIDDTNIESAIVSISDNFISSEDSLGFIDQPGITGTYNPTIGVLVLNGTATLAEYQYAIRTITYNNTSDNPTTLTRTVSFEIYDSDNNSNRITREVNITAVNNAPELYDIEILPTTYTENAAAVAITDNLQLNDMDDSSIDFATVAISSNFVAGEDTLVFTDQSGITGNFDNNTGILQLTGSAFLAEYEQALRSVRYETISDSPSTLTRSIRFQAFDNDNASQPVTRDIELTAVNDAPTIADLESNTLTFQENASPLPVTSSLSLNDLDDTHLGSARVVISANLEAAYASLSFSDQSGITGSYDAANGVLTLTGNATIAEYEAALRSVAYINHSNNPSGLTRTIDFIVNDNELDSNIASRDLTLTTINDRPALASLESNPLRYFENQAPITITDSLTVTDADDSMLESARIAINNNYFAAQDRLLFSQTDSISGTFDSSTGVLNLSGTATLAQYQQAIRSISYMNISDAPSILPRTIEFSVEDNDSQSTTVSKLLELQSVNDAPAARNNLINFLEDTPYILIADDFGFSDPDGHNFAGVTIEKLPILGTLSLIDDKVIQGQFIGISDISAGNLYFTPEPDANGTAYDSIEFKVLDDGSTNFGGINTSSAANDISFDLIPVSDPPTGTDKLISTPEDNTYVFSREDFGFTDPADNNDFQAITVGLLPDKGVLLLNGSELEADTVINISLIDNGLLQYTPPENLSSTGNDGFSFKVHDDGNTANGGVSIDQTENFISFDLPSVNATPMLNTGDATFDEGSENILTTNEINAIDSDDLLPEELTFTINSLPMNGALTLNGVPAKPGSEFTLKQLIDDQLIYTHDGSETSADFFDIQVRDGGEDGAAPASGRFSFQINEVIDPAPSIDDESVLLDFNETFDSTKGSELDSGYNTLAANALAENPSLIVSIESKPLHGEVTIEPDGSFNYTHDGSQVQQDSFSYRVTNEDDISSVATVSISIEPMFESAFENTITLEPLNEVPVNNVVPVQSEPELEVEQTDRQESTDETEAQQSAEDSQTTNPDNEPTESSETNSSQINLDLTQNTLLVNKLVTTTGRFIEVTTTGLTESVFSRSQITYNPGLTELGIQNHNIVSYTQFEFDFSTAINLIDFTALSDVETGRAREVISNRRFMDGLEQLEKDFEETENSHTKRYRLATDSTVGVSLSATAGILAWVLRGGALFASVMAYTPIWSSIDPVRVLAGKKENKVNDSSDNDVEQLFSEK